MVKVQEAYALNCVHNKKIGDDNMSFKLTKDWQCRDIKTCKVVKRRGESIESFNKKNHKKIFTEEQQFLIIQILLILCFIYIIIYAIFAR
jgi:hypothetical protein